MSTHAFRYKGYDGRGRKVEGEVTARTIDEAERKIASQDVTIIAVVASGRASKDEESTENSRARKGRRISDADAAVVLRNLSVMVETGVPFVEALDAVSASARPPADDYVRAVKQEIVGGKSLSNAMKAAPRLFPPLVADMVRVAEDGGKLDHALASSADYLERSADLRKKILAAMLYPMVMLTVSLSTIAVLILFVMPRFGSVFTKMKVDLPVTTRLLLSLGDFVRGKPALAAIVAAAGIIGLVACIKIPVARRALIRCVRRMPMVGDLMEKLALSRAFMSIATLLGANVPVLSALEHGARVASDPRVTQGLEQVRSSVEHGGTMSDAMKETRIFPAMLVQMVAVGERTGRLSMLLTSCAGRMEQDVDSRLKTVVALVEPLMIVLMGVIVGTITVSIIAPIYSVVENIK